MATWRAAERQWERHGSAADVHLAALAVIDAWAAYQDAAVSPTTAEFMLVANDDQTYVAATAGVKAVLGYEPHELIGMRIQDLAAPDLQAATPDQWAAFLADGRQDGSYRLSAKNGRLVSLRYVARAHHPVPGFHMSRMWTEAEDPANGVGT